MDIYDRQLFDETMKPFINSGHAFVCFDSVTSLNAIIRHYRETPLSMIQAFCYSLFGGLSGCCRKD